MASYRVSFHSHYCVLLLNMNDKIQVVRLCCANIARKVICLPWKSAYEKMAFIWPWISIITLYLQFHLAVITFMWLGLSLLSNINKNARIKASSFEIKNQYLIIIHYLKTKKKTYTEMSNDFSLKFSFLITRILSIDNQSLVRH